jgi:hypothetical protein
MTIHASHVLITATPVTTPKPVRSVLMTPTDLPPQPVIVMPGTMTMEQTMPYVRNVDINVPHVIMVQPVPLVMQEENQPRIAFAQMANTTTAFLAKFVNINA